MLLPLPFLPTVASSPPSHPPPPLPFPAAPRRRHAVIIHGVSVYDTTRSLSFRVGGTPSLLRASLATAGALDRRAPWLGVPSIPDVFRPFCAYLLYGLHMSGPAGPALLCMLCCHAHNIARKNPVCVVVAADIAPNDPAAAVVLHWQRFSCDEDIWCIKKLMSVAANGNAGGNDNDDWTTTPPPSVLFVDPREF